MELPALKVGKPRPTPVVRGGITIIDNAGEKQDINVQKEISKAIRRREKKYITQIEEAKELLETVDKIWD